MTAPGTLIAGRYRLTAQVAAGGMGSVWEAWDELLQRRVAVKLLLPQPGMSREDATIARSRVIREARITARLHHPHAVTLYDVVEHAGQPCLIMQYVSSRSLNVLLQERGVLAPPVVARIGAEVASALAAAHLVGIIHRDVKPSNVLIIDDGSAKLTDFGISHAAGDISLTSTGMVSGTPAYLAPEVARGGASGFPADVFSLGATLYAAMEGTPPFGTDLNPMAILHRVASGQVLPPRRSGPLTPLIRHMLASDAADRPAMEEVARTLADAAAPVSAAAELAHSPTTALPSATVREWPEPPAPAVSRPQSNWSELQLDRPAPFTEQVPLRAGRRSGRRRRTRLLGAMFIVALLALVGVGVAAFTRPDRPDSPVNSAGGKADATSSTGQSIASTASRARGAAAPTVPRSAAGTAEKKPVPTAAPTTAPARGRPSTVGSSGAATPARAALPITTAQSPTARPAPSAPASHASNSVNAPEATPTAGQLAGALTAYYAALPAGTAQGWDHLTPHFQDTIASDRGSYQAFWDGMAAVEVSDVQGVPPDTVLATVTYHRTDGQVIVESTRFRLVRSAGILKIDDQSS